MWEAQGSDRTRTPQGLAGRRQAPLPTMGRLAYTLLECRPKRMARPKPTKPEGSTAIQV